MEDAIGEKLKHRYQQPNQTGMQKAGFSVANLTRADFIDRQL
jgi:hypothetical protein